MTEEEEARNKAQENIIVEWLKHKEEMMSPDLFSQFREKAAKAKGEKLTEEEIFLLGVVTEDFRQWIKEQEAEEALKDKLIVFPAHSRN
jgi:hypothetical protein